MYKMSCTGPSQGVLAQAVMSRTPLRRQVWLVMLEARGRCTQNSGAQVSSPPT